MVVMETEMYFLVVIATDGKMHQQKLNFTDSRYHSNIELNGYIPHEKNVATSEMFLGKGPNSFITILHLMNTFCTFLHLK